MSSKPYDRLYFDPQEAEWRAMKDVQTVLRMYGFSSEISLEEYDSGEPDKHRYIIEICSDLGDEN